MLKYDIKYRPLKDNDSGGNPHRGSNSKSNQYRIHWTIKLLFLAFLSAQLLYLLYASDSKYFNRNAISVITKCDTNDQCDQDNGKINHQSGHQLITEGKINDIHGTSAAPSQHPVSINVKDTPITLATTIGSIKSQHDQQLTTTSARASSTVAVIHNESSTATTRSTYSTEVNKATASGVANITAIDQWTTMTNLLLTTTAARTLKPTIPVPPNAIVVTEPRARLQQRKYYINTSRCHIPFIDPFTPEALKVFHPSHKTGCTKDKAIITASFDGLTKRYLLHTNYTVAMDFIKNATEETVADDLLCCYRQIERSGSGDKADKQFKLLPCTNFHHDFVVPSHINGIIVDCKSKSKGTLVQQDAFAFIQTNPKYEKENKTNTSGTGSSTEGGRKLGMLLIGIDSLSRTNFRRNMPETLKYLEDKGWYEMKGYNKVGENTFPNLIPFLTGYTEETAFKKCNPKIIGNLDDCNFIWTKFHEHGFATAYAEDTADIGTFNYLKKGFKNPPTDYYFRPIALAMEKTMQKTTKARLEYCVGRHQYGEYIYDYGVEFATRYQNRSNFGLFWTNSFSHSLYDGAAAMDTTMRKYLEDIEVRGLVETSVVMFFSDHGTRWGPLVKLPEGFLEERLPMFFISLPTWLKRDYPSLVKNLEVNQRRLTTPLDIYMTMQQLLQMAEPAYNMTPAYDCAKAQSILQEVPEDRTCEEACIPETWCTCISYTLLSTKSDVVKTVTQLILEEMNKYIVSRNISSLCSELTLLKIERAKLRDVDVSMQSSNTTTYLIEFTTKPKTKPVTAFSATADFDAIRQRISLNVEDISRQSKYEGTAKCIDDKQAKKYCICRDSLKSS